MTESLIETTRNLEDFIASLPTQGAVCAVDTEADSLHCYREKLCLIQFNCGDQMRLIDPLTISDLSPLLTFFERGTEVWMHGADFDMSILKRTFGTIPPVVFDTQTAARLVGYRRFGLAYLVEDLFGVKLSKQSQRADWGKRPLPDKMVEYALNDVRYILQLRDFFVEKLNAIGRYEWFVQSCESARVAVLSRPEKSEDNLWRIAGSGRLGRLGLAYLRELWIWRDEEAMRLDRPAFKVLGNDLLISMATSLESGKEDAELSGRHREAVRGRFRQAVHRVRRLPREEWPERRLGTRSERDPDFRGKFEEIRRKRDSAASRLDIDETLIAPKSVLEQLVLDRDAALASLLPWQREIIGGPAQSQSQ